MDEHFLQTAKYRLVICSECFNVKAVLSNMMGVDAHCPHCQKMMKHYSTNNFIQADPNQKL